MSFSPPPFDGKTSWESSSSWYDQVVGEKGLFYHQTLILPGVDKFIKEGAFKGISLIDLACGQGILGRHISTKIPYLGMDISPSLIKLAKQYDRSRDHAYIVGDITQSLPEKAQNFTHATVILALQNITHPLNVFKNVSKALIPDGRFMFVINHPCFRIPRQSSWQIEEKQNLRFRRIDRYMSSMEIPIQTNPGKGENSAETFSFHHPISAYTQWLKEAGFMIETIEEWCSTKKSSGKAAKRENRSRQEIPLFMAVKAILKS